MDPPNRVVGAPNPPQIGGPTTTYDASHVTTNGTTRRTVKVHDARLCPEAWVDRDGQIFTGHGPYFRRPWRVLRRKVNHWIVRRGWSR